MPLKILYFLCNEQCTVKPPQKHFSGDNASQYYTQEQLSWKYFNKEIDLGSMKLDVKCDETLK
jgi:hypothetical protein